MTNQPACLCLHTLDQHTDALFCLAPGCTCLFYEADVCGLPPTRHSEHTRPVRGCLSCEDELADARQIEHDAPWQDV
jgi:hypothetical protein